MSERNWQEDWQTYQDKIEAVYAFRRLRRDPYETRIPIFELEEFFEFAREALPYWLQRVRELEAQVQDLKERAEATEEAAVDYARRLDQFHKENEELQERWRELKKSVVAVVATNYDLERAMKRLEVESAHSKEKVQELEAQKNGAYTERNKCVSLIARMALALGLRAGIRTDENAEEGWRHVVTIDLPAGQVSWHIHDSELPMFSFLPSYDGEWDGHNTEEKYKRVLEPGDLNQRVRELEQYLQDELWYQEDREKAAVDLIKQLEAENRCLKTVAEAAREYMRVCTVCYGCSGYWNEEQCRYLKYNAPEHMRCPQMKLKEALATLEGGEADEVHQVQSGR